MKEAVGGEVRRVQHRRCGRRTASEMQTTSCAASMAALDPWLRWLPCRPRPPPPRAAKRAGGSRRQRREREQEGVVPCSSSSTTGSFAIGARSTTTLYWPLPHPASLLTHHGRHLPLQSVLGQASGGSLDAESCRRGPPPAGEGAAGCGGTTPPTERKERSGEIEKCGGVEIRVAFCFAPLLF
jgi:hypothetical protein